MLQKDKGLRTHTASLKPQLKESNKIHRLFYALDCVEGKDFEYGTRSLTFKTFYDTIHVDEKWFYLVKEGTKYILVHDEDPPELSVYNKNSIIKVMFLCALAWPKQVDHSTYFDGKVGIWPVCCMKPAQRTWKRRKRGTMEGVKVNVDKEEYCRLLLNMVIPAILEHWPTKELEDDEFVICIQQDGASLHIVTDDAPWLG